jgi:hypothetical protein
MSSNRLKYDNCAYVTDIKESTSPLEYNLFVGKYEKCERCPVGDFTNVLEFGDRADVENELFGLTRSNSKCPGKKYDPSVEFKNPNVSDPRLCESIYHITPNNLEKPTTNMLNNSNLGKILCENNQNSTNEQK